MSKCKRFRRPASLFPLLHIRNMACSSKDDYYQRKRKSQGFFSLDQTFTHFSTFCDSKHLYYKKAKARAKKKNGKQCKWNYKMCTLQMHHSKIYWGHFRSPCMFSINLKIIRKLLFSFCWKPSLCQHLDFVPTS